LVATADKAADHTILTGPGPTFTTAIVTTTA
jgi:hypothetical protein